MILAAGQPARQNHAGEMGHSRFRIPLSAASRRGCGCRKPPWTPKRWKCSPRMGSNSRFSRRARPNACAATTAANGKMSAGDRIDPSRAYLAELPSKRTINLFFYDGPISQGVAFEGLLNDGKRFADRLLGGFSDARHWPQLSHIATDGESYGHHHHYGEMALTYALHHIERKQTRRADQLRPIPGKTSAGSIGRNRRRQLLELRPRHRTLAIELRLQFRRTRWVESGMARSAARRAGLAARPAGSSFRTRTGEAASKIRGTRATNTFA